jgi:CubicO group peptidase (beta-lactamase class C family)
MHESDPVCAPPGRGRGRRGASGATRRPVRAVAGPRTATRRDLAGRVTIVAAVLLLALVIAACRDGAPAQTAQRLPIYVSPDGRGDYATLDAAVREAPAGATILLDPGTYRLARPLDVFRSLTIVAPVAGGSVVESGAPGHVLGFDGHGELRLVGLTLRSRTRQADRPTDVLLVRGGRVQLAGCRLEGAVAGLVTERTASGPRRVAAGGAGLRALGVADVLLTDCAFAGNALAGVARERGATVTVAGTATGLGRPGGADVAFMLPDKTGPTSAAGLTRFLDPQVGQLMRELNVPGAVVTVVHDGRVLYQDGFGMADVRRRVPVDPERTRFALASVTKLFTATAVMQLWERGRIDLNRAVRSYVPDTPSGPSAGRQLTVADLLTHAGGFDERWIGIAAPSPSTAPSLGVTVRTRAPARVLPPASVSSYANYDMTLLGAAVGAVSGGTFEDWVGRQILAPLGMTATAFGKSVAGRGDVARSYTWNGGFQPRAAETFVSAPAGGLSSTGADMARFMLAQLQQGSLGTARILRPATVAAMHARHFANAPALPGYAYGFAERYVENRRALEHTGDFNGYSAAVFLVPGEDLGIFVADNGGGGRFCQEVVDRVMAHYFRDRDQLGRPQAPLHLTVGLGQFVGAYRPFRHAHTTIDKWVEFSADSDLVVTREPDGVLVIDDTRYAQIEPLQFRELYDDSWVGFARDSGGGVAFAFRGTLAYERLGWWETHVAQRRLIILFSVVFGFAALAWAVAPLLNLIWHAPQWVRRLLAHQPFAARDPRPARVARALAGAVAILDLAFLGIIGGALTGDAVRFGVPAWLVAALVLPLLAATLSAGMAGMGVAAWLRGWWTATGRVLYCLLTLVAVLFVWFVNYWNLLGFRF